ncbi:MAG: hypothetical protein OQJ89_04595 [Kangiellaceae bacterium]|nr:hypothetical protein [Kangiellaceae bacterium]MCW9016222.1 hypothetical protein [Kangiellaceae bacterium]
MSLYNPAGTLTGFIFKEKYKDMFSRFRKKRLKKEHLGKEKKIIEDSHRETVELLKDAHDVVGVIGVFLTSYLKYMKTSHEMCLLHALSYNLYHMESRLQVHLYKLGANTNPREERVNVIRNPPYLEVNLFKTIEEFLAGRDIEGLRQQAFFDKSK